jgi:hypothetical protein
MATSYPSWVGGGMVTSEHRERRDIIVPQVESLFLPLIHGPGHGDA